MDGLDCLECFTSDENVSDYISGNLLEWYLTCLQSCITVSFLVDTLIVCWCLPPNQCEFQDPKMEVLYHIRPINGGEIPLHTSWCPPVLSWFLNHCRYVIQTIVFN